MDPISRLIDAKIRQLVPDKSELWYTMFVSEIAHEFNEEGWRVIKNESRTKVDDSERGEGTSVSRKSLQPQG